MEFNEKKVVREVIYGFFIMFLVLVKEKSKDVVSWCLLLLNDFYLLSKEGFFKYFYELIFYDCFSFEWWVRDFVGDFVDISREGELIVDCFFYFLSFLLLCFRVKII